MKRLLAVFAFLAVGLAQFAFADNLEIALCDPANCTATTMVITPSTPGALSSTVGTTFNLSWSGTFDGWSILVAGGSSNSPGVTPYALDSFDLVATNTTGVANDLGVYVTDNGFTTSATGFVNTFSQTVSGGTGVSAQEAWLGATNTLFGTGTPLCLVGPLSGTNNGACSANDDPGSPYSLTLSDTFDDVSGDTSFSSDGSLTAVPEPASILLLGSGLLGLAKAARRRFSK